MNVTLFDEALTRANLLPLTFTRPVCEIRVGILTMREKWEACLNTAVGYLTQPHLSKKFASTHNEGVFVNGAVCPTSQLAEALQKLPAGHTLYKNDTLVAFNGKAADLNNLQALTKTEFSGDFLSINQLWEIFQKNGEAIQADFHLLTKNKQSQPLSASVTVIGDKSLVFLEPGAKAEACILNTSAGPIYIGKDAEIMEGSVVRGPFALCEHSTLKLSTKVYGATTVGPHSKVGGEVSNSVILGYSNKGHDGFLGNSVIGEWCNLGADTNNSNLKNNYANVKVYNYAQKKMVDSCLQFCGLMMGDHSKSGINTMFNTGTVVGVGCNVYGGGFPPTHIRDFSWGGSEGFELYKTEKLFETAEKVYERRGLVFTDVEKDILRAVFAQTT